MVDDAMAPQGRRRLDLNPLAALLVVILGGALAWSLTRVPEQPRPPEATKSSAAPAPSAAQAWPVDVGASDPETPASAPPLRVPVIEQPPSMAELENAQRRLLATLDTRFRSDTVDRAWAPDAEKRLVDVAAEPVITAFGVPTQFAADCRSRMCRIAMRFADRTQADDWATIYPVQMAGTLTAVRTHVAPREDGSVEVVFYGTRGGSEALIQR